MYKSIDINGFFYFVLFRCLSVFVLNIAFTNRDALFLILRIKRKRGGVLLLQAFVNVNSVSVIFG